MHLSDSRALLFRGFRYPFEVNFNYDELLIEVILKIIDESRKQNFKLNKTCFDSHMTS